jgi:cyclase
VSIDARRHKNGRYECYSHSGQVKRGVDPVTWAKDVERLGAGEILLTSIERDGTMEGYDIELIKSVAEGVNIPVIASGGAANYDDFCIAIKDGGARAVAAASIYHFTEQTPLEAKKHMAVQNILVRK